MARTFPSLVLAVLMISTTVPATLGATTGPSNPAPMEMGAERSGALGDRVEDGLLEDLDPVRNTIVVQFEQTIPDRLRAEHPSLHVLYEFESLPALAAVAPEPTVRSLAQDDRVAFLEDGEKAIEFDLDTATEATRARHVWDAEATGADGPVEVDGETVDGSGVGVAIVDTGVETLHPDLDEDKVKASYLAGPQGVVPAVDTTPQTGHGTAVAGAAAGTGEASGGTFAGSAPGAGLYSFNVEPVSDEANLGYDGSSVLNPEEGTTLFPAMAFDWILQNGDDQEPPIEVVNNAWHCQTEECQQLNPDQIHVKLASQLAENGIVVTWSAGDWDRGVVPESTNPTPGVVGVGGYDDRDLGIRDSCKADVSSIAHLEQPTEWPDVAAPATGITTTADLHTDVDTYLPQAAPYHTEEGTSLAAGQVAGIASLLLDANPDLTPGQVEWILEETATNPPADFCNTAYVAADPTHLGSEANHRTGHGLVHALDAVQVAQDFEGIDRVDGEPEDPTPEMVTNDNEGVDVTERFYLDQDAALAPTRPVADDGRSLVLDPDESVAFTTEPLDEARTFTGIDSSLWMRITTEAATEAYSSFLSPVAITASVEVVSDGTVVDGRTVSTDYIWSPLDRVRERPFVQPFGSQLQAEPGDRLQISLQLREAGAAGDGSELTTWSLHWGSWETPSHLGIGEAVSPLPLGTYEGCREPEHTATQCIWVDADHPSAKLACEGSGTNQVVWEGPGGTGVRMACYSSIAQCTVPEDVAWGECRKMAHTSKLGSDGPHVCEVIADGPVPDEAHGRCQLVVNP